MRRRRRVVRLRRRAGGAEEEEQAEQAQTPSSRTTAARARGLTPQVGRHAEALATLDLGRAIASLGAHEHTRRRNSLS